MDCNKTHVPVCMAETWGMATRDEHGELKPAEKVHVFRM